MEIALQGLLKESCPHPSVGQFLFIKLLAVWDDVGTIVAATLY